LADENPITKAIFQITQEYQRLKKESSKKQAPKVTSKRAPGIDPIKRKLEERGINVNRLRRRR
jgi:chromosome condensin MukBEF MukE localization factor